MSDRTVIKLPGVHESAGTITDHAALNDIHALLCARGTADPDALADIAQILARAGRAVIKIRDIGVTVIEEDGGLPEACVDAGATKVSVFQAESGGLVVQIRAEPADVTGLTVTLNGHRLHPPTAPQRPQATHSRRPSAPEGPTP